MTNEYTIKERAEINLPLKLGLSLFAFISTIALLTIFKQPTFYYFIVFVIYAVWLSVPNKYFYIESKLIRARPRK